MSARVITTVEEFREACDEVRASGGVLGLVPTMGALHEGHLALVREAKSRATVVALTLFVNPTQFGPGEDLDKYPRQLEQDVQLASSAGASLVFAPTVAEMYPAGESTRVTVKGVTEHLCGASRPGHFDGVATIVTKLFIVAGPCVAVFGRKDYQQVKVIERMVQDLLLPVGIVGHPTVREPDGLALSSRNRFLSPEERARALAIPAGLAKASALFDAGVREVKPLREAVVSSLQGASLEILYVAVTDPDTLQPLEDSASVEGRALIALAARCGATRLIDNVVLGEEPAPSVTARHG